MTNPEKAFRAGACSASVLANERKIEQGTKTFRSIAFSCRYKDEATGAWKDAGSMSLNEAARGLIVLQKALEYCVLRESEAKKWSPPSSSDEPQPLSTWWHSPRTAWQHPSTHPTLR